MVMPESIEGLDKLLDAGHRRGHPGTEAYICSVIIAVVSLRSDAHSSGEKSRGSAEKDTGHKTLDATRARKVC